MDHTPLTRLAALIEDAVYAVQRAETAKEETSAYLNAAGWSMKQISHGLHRAIDTTTDITPEQKRFLGLSPSAINTAIRVHKGRTKDGTP